MYSHPEQFQPWNHFLDKDRTTPTRERDVDQTDLPSESSRSCIHRGGNSSVTTCELHSSRKYMCGMNQKGQWVSYIDARRV